MAVHTGVYDKGKISLIDLIKELKKSSDFQKTGAIALFIGVVRGETEKGEKVQKLELEAYEEKANEALANICEELKKRNGIVSVQIYHLLGEFNVGEDIVYVSVAGDHRYNVFPVLQEAIERYKREVPVFKKEHVVATDGKKCAYWIEERV